MEKEDKEEESCTSYYEGTELKANHNADTDNTKSLSLY